MNKMKMRTLVAVCLALALAAGTLTMFSLAGVGDDTPTVVYDYRQKGFEFRNVTVEEGNTYPNLFRSLQGLMPGDEVEQEIAVGVANVPENSYVYLYLKSYPTWEDKNMPDEITRKEKEAYETLAEALKLKVKNDKGEELTSAMATSDNGVLLGTFKGSDKRTLTVDVELALEAENELANMRGEIGWEFRAEVYTNSLPPVGPITSGNEDHYAYIIGYDDGLVHPEALITRAESVTIFFRMLKEAQREEYWSTVNPYYDVFPEHWYNNAISTMTRAGVVKGYPNGNFGPMDNITRAEFAVMAVRFFAGKYDVEVTEDYFPDIEGHWANYEINLAYLYNLVLGTPEGNFEPDREITRAEAVTIVNRVLERYPDKDHLLEDMIVWPDNMDEDMWYYADMQEATNSHIYDLSGDKKKNSNVYEIWTELLEVRDWAALEREWSKYNSSHNPGEVVSSRISSNLK